MAGTGIHTGLAAPSRYFPPSLRVKGVTGTGAAVRGATVKLYPVEWFSSSVGATPVLKGRTSTTGVLTLPSNPFRPGATAPWNIGRPDFLVQVVAPNGARGYGWMPLPSVSNAYFAAPKSACTLKVVR